MSRDIIKNHISNIAKIFSFDKRTRQKLPLFISKISAGFPSPADDFIEKKLDLNEYLIKKPAATFFVQVEGMSMIGAGINSGDILIVDRSLEAVDNSIVVAMFAGEFTIKRLKKKGKSIYLMAENPDYNNITVTADDDFEVWGVVTYVIHRVK